VDLRGSSAAIGNGLLRAHAESGVCRVICFTPRHDLSLARIPVADIRTVVDCWADESARIGALEDIAHIQLFENKGALMGCSNPHPHAQLWATGHVPTTPARLLATQSAYAERTGRDLLGDYLAQELRMGERIIVDNDHFVALVPFWAVWPFEALVLPRRPARDLASLDDEERDGLADLLHRLTVRYDNLFQCEFPYSMGLAQQPTDGGDHPGWRFHTTFYPPLLRSATIRKFLVGYELAAEPQRDLSAEDAAERLRAQPERHYLDGGE
jgi:UDPglucose--hexose-1-phosphate uridylyltransferase